MPTIKITVADENNDKLEGRVTGEGNDEARMATRARWKNRPGGMFREENLGLTAAGNGSTITAADAADRVASVGDRRRDHLRHRPGKSKIWKPGL